ncbi:uncharacterized protein LOC34621906, partial [Cyclospora cayetanensis]|uniref:Uncharacterized protein LOC34621906 n=1 Tax=Cyclospora cayetanensis TaxID=88456 RepID=A0A6P6RY27_9EIME
MPIASSSLYEAVQRFCKALRIPRQAVSASTPLALLDAMRAVPPDLQQRAVDLLQHLVTALCRVFEGLPTESRPQGRLELLLPLLQRLEKLRQLPNDAEDIEMEAEAEADTCAGSDSIRALRAVSILSGPLRSLASLVAFFIDWMLGKALKQMSEGSKHAHVSALPVPRMSATDRQRRRLSVCMACAGLWRLFSPAVDTELQGEEQQLQQLLLSIFLRGLSLQREGSGSSSSTTGRRLDAAAAAAAVSSAKHGLQCLFVQLEAQLQRLLQQRHAAAARRKREVVPPEEAAEAADTEKGEEAEKTTDAEAEALLSELVAEETVHWLSPLKRIALQPEMRVLFELLSRMAFRVCDCEEETESGDAEEAGDLGEVETAADRGQRRAEPSRKAQIEFEEGFLESEGEAGASEAHTTLPAGRETSVSSARMHEQAHDIPTPVATGEATASPLNPRQAPTAPTAATSSPPTSSPDDEEDDPMLRLVVIAEHALDEALSL